MKTVTTPNGRFYTPDGTDLKLPSVTTILGSMSDKSGIDDWIKKVGKKEANRISTNAANRGTFMHLLCENYLRKKYEEKLPEENMLKDTFIETMDDKEVKDFSREQLISGKNLFMNMHRDGVFNTIDDVVIQEVALWSINGGGYAGRVDLIAKMINGNLVVIDFKSSGKPKKREWIENYFLQASAYAFAYYERHNIMPQTAEIWISNEQNEVPQIFKLNLDELKEYYTKFISYVKGYHAKIK